MPEVRDTAPLKRQRATFRTVLLCPGVTLPMTSRPCPEGTSRITSVTAPKTSPSAGIAGPTTGSLSLPELADLHRFFAPLVLRQVRVVPGSGKGSKPSQRPSRKPASPGVSRTERSPLSAPQPLPLSLTPWVWPEPLRQSLETRLAELARRQCRGSPEERIRHE